MPVQVERIEHGIYHVIWKGYVLIEEVLINMERIRDGSAGYNEDGYIIIVNFAAATHYPMDVQIYKQILDNPKMVTAVALKAPTVAQILGRMITALTRQDYVFVDTLEAGVIAARGILAKRLPSYTPPTENIVS